MCSPDAPPAPDYAGAANATAAGNLEAVRAQTAANRVNQVTPQGNLTYTHNPEKVFDETGYNNAMTSYNSALANYNASGLNTGNGGAMIGQFPSSGATQPGYQPVMPNKDDYYKGGGDDGWTATQTYSPDQQAIYQGNVDLSKGLLGTAQSGLGKVDEMLKNPAIDQSKLASMPTNPGESYTDAAMRYMQPTQDRQREQLRTQMANQGITMGSEAYQNAQGDQADQFGRDNLQAVMAGMDKNMTARQQGIQEQNYVNTYPLNIINALRTGSQVSNPNFVNVAQQGYAPGADLLGASQAQYNGLLGASNAQNANTSNTLTGLATAAAMAFSDRRLKKNIRRIGTHHLGIGIYEYDYVWGEHAVGVMADEVAKVRPSAVVQHESGFAMVDYGRL